MPSQKIPIPAASIKANTRIPFDLYLFINKHFINYKKKGDTLDDKKIERIEEKNLFYIDKSELSNFRKYVKLLSIEDKELEEIDKEFLSASTQLIIDDLFTEKDITETAQNAKVIVETLVDKITKNPKSLSNILDLIRHDYYTYNHSIDVCAYTIAFANQLYKDQIISDINSIESFGFGGLLHDIGKKEIPEEIINKTGPLNSNEWNVIKTHPLLGVKILNELKIVNPNIINAVAQHHEQMDGTGYPNQKKGYEIPLVAKIVTICDVFDALTTKRSYSEFIKPSEALSIIKFDMAGKFDGELLFIFEKKIYPLLLSNVINYQKGF